MIEINNLTTVSIDEEFIKKVGQKVLEEELLGFNIDNYSINNHKKHARDN